MQKKNFGFVIVIAILMNLRHTVQKNVDRFFLLFLTIVKDVIAL
jgi:hypothetical protein